MGNVDREKYLFEIHETDGRVDRFIGNAGIVVYPNGNRSLVTAMHVVYDGSTPRKVVVKNKIGRYEFDNRNLHFEKRKEADVAEMELSRGEGILVAEEADLSDLLKIVGTAQNFYSHHEIKVRPIWIGGKEIATLPDKKKVKVNGIVIHYEGADDQQKTFPGTSGSLVLDGNGQALGVHVTNSTGKYNDGNYHGIAWLLPK